MFIEITSDIYFKALDQVHIGCSFKFPVKVGVEESIVNAPRISCLTVVCVEWCVHNRLFNATFNRNFK
jgi:hypothetical protein